MNLLFVHFSKGVNLQYLLYMCITFYVYIFSKSLQYSVYYLFMSYIFYDVFIFMSILNSLLFVFFSSFFFGRQEKKKKKYCLNRVTWRVGFPPTKKTYLTFQFEDNTRGTIHNVCSSVYYLPTYLVITYFYFCVKNFCKCC